MILYFDQYNNEGEYYLDKLQHKHLDENKYYLDILKHTILEARKQYTLQIDYKLVRIILYYYQKNNLQDIRIHTNLYSSQQKD